MSIPLHSIAGFSPLVADYLMSSPTLRYLYKYDFNIEAFKEIIADKATNHTDRNLLVSVLEKQYEGIVPNALTKANIESLRSENTFTITAAHQPCVLLGPVFNIYKISSTINLALQLKAKYPNNNFVPIFWMGSEDHDFEELGNTCLYGKRVEWLPADGSGGAIGRYNIDHFEKVIDEVETIIGEPSKAFTTILRDGLNRFTTFGAYTRFIIHELFGDFGLVVIDQDDPQLKKSFGSIIAEELQHSTASKVVEPTIKWLSDNYHAQAAPRDINLFYLDKNSRNRIVKTDTGYQVHNTNLLFTHDEMLTLATTQPECFSPNVILRPVYQELVLPNLAFIGGAGELSYWLELRAIFEHFGVNFPMLVQRSSFTIVTAATQKKMDKLGLSVADFFDDVEAIISRYVKTKLSDEVLLDKEKKELETIFANITAKAEKVDITLTGAVNAEKQKQLTAIDAIAGKILKAEKRKQEESITQIRAVHQAIMPNGSWQEREENFLPYFTNDPNFISRVIKQANPLEMTMNII